MKLQNKMWKVQILEVLEQGGAVTSQNVADKLGLAVKLASAHLCNLRKTGVVKVIGQMNAADTGGRPCNLWGLT